MNLSALRGVIISVQPETDSVLAEPHIVAELAACALANGAVAVRIEGESHIRAVRARNPDAAIVGLIKGEASATEPYITATLRDVTRVLDSGAQIVAFDATRRARPDGSSVGDAVRAIHKEGALAFADCAQVEDAQSAHREGADIVATTLCGYTQETRGALLPAIKLLSKMKSSGAFLVCEGGIATPDHASRAFAAGADAIVIGTAITNVDLRVRRFVEAFS